MAYFFDFGNFSPVTDINFQLKGTTMTLVVLELRCYQQDTFDEQLAEIVQRAPQFFDQSPLLISLAKLDEPEKLVELEPLLKQCRAWKLQPVAFKSVPPCLLDAVRASGLACLPEATSQLASRELAPPVVKTEIREVPVARGTKVIVRPVRSGQQVYAEGADLVVLANVSKGAEVLADGSVHIYGALRGRALAGVRGAQDARIFCQQMEAELVSVAGNFLPSDAIDGAMNKHAVQVYLDGESLKIERTAQ